MQSLPGGDLFRRQNAASTGLGSLRKFHFHRADIELLASFNEWSFGESTLLISSPVIPGSQLPDQPASMIMVRRNAAFARVVD